MKRNVFTILLLLCSIGLMVGGVFLYRSLSEAPAPSALTSQAPAADPGTSGEDPAAPADGDGNYEASIVGDQPAQEDSDLDPAVDFAFTDRNGNLVRLSDFYGKPIIINFWATWCGPCQMELPYFNSAYGQYGDQIQFFMVDLVDGSYETQNGTIDFVDSNGYRFPLYFDSEGEALDAYGISAIPLTVFINAEGRIVSTHTGSFSEEQLMSEIAAFLG